VLLLSFTPGKTGAIGWPALQAGPGVIAFYPGQNRGYWKSIPYSWVGFITIIITWQYRGYWKTSGYIGITDTGGVIIQ
jgi:hypothetical protein